MGAFGSFKPKGVFLEAFGGLLRADPRGALSNFFTGVHLQRRPLPHLDASFSGYQILMYHRVIKTDDPFAMAPVLEQDFEAQMVVLKRHFRPVSLEQLLLEVAEGRVHPRTVCITFDDGYRDNYEVAFPILKAHSIPATIFLATDFIGSGETTWYDRVLQQFRLSKAAKLDFPPAGFQAEDISHPNGRRDLAFRCLEKMKVHPPSARDNLILQLGAALDVPSQVNHDLMLDWAMVREMRRSGIGFGGHTCSHPILSTLDKESAAAEISGSKTKLESELQESVSHFAYPNGRSGDFNEDTKAAIKGAGFTCALTTNPGINLPGEDLYEVKRVQPWEPSINRFLGRMALERFLA
jgi:peptidoglycan/xylan/chitin deacetylase (PgdA/CDA1 family)